MGKILVCSFLLNNTHVANAFRQAPNGTRNVEVGKVIALLAEEGDDISNLEAPKEDAQPPQQAKQPEQAPPAPPPPPPSAGHSPLRNRVASGPAAPPPPPPPAGRRISPPPTQVVGIMNGSALGRSKSAYL